MKGKRLPAHGRLEPAFRRLASLVPLDEAAMGALIDAASHARQFKARSQLLAEGQPLRDPLLLLKGWAARTRVMEDGRRQIIEFVLPGDVVGHGCPTMPADAVTLVALTPVSLCIAPAPSVSSQLEAAYVHGRALNEAYLFGQIARLGRMNAHERLEDLCVELFDRLDLAGLTEKNGFAMPITQEIVADALGMTPVHVNRMVQQARQTRTLSWGGGVLTLHDADAMRRRVGRPRILPACMA